MGKLSALMVKAVHFPDGKARPVRFGDGDGLYLQVAPGDTKSWLLRYTLAGKAREMGLGPAGDPPHGVTLAKARILAGEARAKLRQSIDPIDNRQVEREAKARAEMDAKEHTFKAATAALMDGKRAGWRNAKHAAQWRATLEAHAFPVIGDLPVASIGTNEVLQVLRPIWDRIPETASRLRQRIEAVLDAARVKGWCTGDNPARWKGHLAGALPQASRVKRIQHRPALPWQEVNAFMAELSMREGVSALALRFAILTASRTGEVRGMRWREVDLYGKTWVVPGDRMKAGKTHRVPLSPGALSVLHEVRPLMKKPDDLVFPSLRKNVALSDMALSEAVRRMNQGTAKDAPPRWHDVEGRAIVPHGFRSTFRDWAGETRPEGREVVEQALAHTIKDKAEAAYARSDLLEKRRPLMDAWGEHCMRGPVEVVILASRQTRKAG